MMAVYANVDFWKQYKDYLNETRSVHQRAVNCLLEDRATRCQEHLLDLGCGQCLEARTLIVPKLYYGVDVDPPLWADQCTCKADYRKSIILSDGLDVTACSSLFSSEITGDAVDNYRLYNMVFDRYPLLEWLLVSGFYYANRRSSVRVGETGGLLSYQSIEDLADVPLGNLTEIRLTLKVPSTLFGPDVIEVWKLLERA